MLYCFDGGRVACLRGVGCRGWRTRGRGWVPVRRWLRWRGFWCRGSTGAGADGDVGEAEARGSGDAVEVVLFDASAEGVEEAVLDVTLKLEGVLVVGALDLLVLVGGDEAAALVFVAEAEERGDAVGESVVGLVVELVAVGDGVLVRDEEGGLAGGGVAVGSADGDYVAEVLGEGVGTAPKSKVMGVPTLVNCCSCSRLRAMS